MPMRYLLLHRMPVPSKSESKSGVQLDSHPRHTCFRRGTEMKMLKTLVMFAGLLLLGQVSALADPGPDCLGLYADPDGTVSRLEISPGTDFDLYLLLLNSTETTGIHGWECQVEIPSNVLVNNWVLAGQTTNLGAAPEFVVGLGSPVPPAANILLATLSCQTTDINAAAFYLHPATMCLSDPPTPLFVPGHLDPAVGTKPLTYCAGSETEPAFIVNSFGACCYADGGCEYLTWHDCIASGGYPHLPGTYCYPTPCPPLRACCFVDTCRILTEGTCFEMGGQWHPELSSCDPDPCPEPCARPPRGMIAWWPLNEEGSAIFAQELIAGNDCNYVGNPYWDNHECVQYSRRFELPTEYLESVATSGTILDLGTSDFTIDCWFKTDNNSDHVRTLVDKRGADYTGFSLFIYDCRLGFQLREEGATSHSNWVVPIGMGGNVCNTENWQHLAVSVDRDQINGGVMYLDGAPVYTFNPTNHQGSITNNGHLRIGQRTQDTPLVTDAWLDEIEIFRRALSVAEIAEIHAAKCIGKCKEAAYLPPMVSICGGMTSTTTKLTICNYSTSSQTYNWFAFGQPAGPGCSINGNYLTFNPLWGGPVTVPAGECLVVPIIITGPSNFQANETACYGIGVLSSTGSYYTPMGTVRKLELGDPPILPYWCFSVWPLEPFQVQYGSSGSVGFVIRNEGDVTGTFEYQVTAALVDPDGSPAIVGLNGLLPGTVLEGSVEIAAHDSTEINVEAVFHEFEPFLMHSITLATDLDGDEEYDDVVSALVQTYTDSPLTTIQETTPLPDTFRASSFPNPFNPATTISYELPNPATVNLDIYDVSGRLVRSLERGVQRPAGAHAVMWDGKDSAGRTVQSGVFFYRLVAGSRVQTGKMALLK